MYHRVWLCILCSYIARSKLEKQCENVYVYICTWSPWNSVLSKCMHQGRIEAPKAARGHATSRSPCIDGIVLSVTKNNVSS